MEEDHDRKIQETKSRHERALRTLVNQLRVTGAGTPGTYGAPAHNDTNQEGGRNP